MNRSPTPPVHRVVTASQSFPLPGAALPKRCVKVRFLAHL